MSSNHTKLRGVHNFPPINQIPDVFDDWFLPSENELNAMYTELHLNGIGGFNSDRYWSSTEKMAFGNSFGGYINFGDGTISGQYKVSPNINFVRACRSFNSTVSYSLKDIGPAGGWIFWKSGNDYLEAAPTDISVVESIWSNVAMTIGSTAQNTAIGTGQTNTIAIISQDGGASDWYEPSKDELQAMYDNLHLLGVGNFSNSWDAYWSSSEVDGTTAYGLKFATGVMSAKNKFGGPGYTVRACRSFTSTDVYSLRDLGPAKGLIFYIVDLGGGLFTYYEAEPTESDQHTSWIYLDLQTTEIGITAQGTTIGYGLLNSSAISTFAISQGHDIGSYKYCRDLDNTALYTHTNSAAKLCNDLIVIT